MIQDQKLIKAIEVLKREFSPSKLYLFGSRSLGLSNEKSDYDFMMVVKDTNKDRFENMKHARTVLFQECEIKADVFVYPEFEFNEWKDEFGSIPETAINTGVELKF